MILYRCQHQLDGALGNSWRGGATFARGVSRELVPSISDQGKRRSNFAGIFCSIPQPLRGGAPARPTTRGGSCRWWATGQVAARGRSRQRREPEVGNSVREERPTGGPSPTISLNAAAKATNQTPRLALDFLEC